MVHTGDYVVISSVKLPFLNISTAFAVHTPRRKKREDKRKKEKNGSRERSDAGVQRLNMLGCCKLT